MHITSILPLAKANHVAVLGLRGSGYPTSSPEGEPPPQDLEHSQTLNLQLIQAHALPGVLLCLVPP